jgi:hypothetical protein
MEILERRIMVPPFGQGVNAQRAKQVDHTVTDQVEDRQFLPAYQAL